MGEKDRHEISNYYKISLTEIKHSKPLPCNLYIYLVKNRRIILLRKKGFILERSRYDYFKQINFNQLYIHQDEVNTFLGHNWSDDDSNQTISQNMFHDDISSQIISGFVDKEILNIISSELASKHEAAIKILSSMDETTNSSENIREGEVQNIEKTTVVSKEELIERELTTQIIGDWEKDDHFKIKIGSKTANNTNKMIISGDNEKIHREKVSIRSRENKHKHSISVSRKAAFFAKALGYDDQAIIEYITLAGILHDIGYCRIPASIRKKNPNELTFEERALYVKHPEIAIEILKETVDPHAIVKRIIREHHENFDGSGFPKGLKGTKIHEFARLLAIADEYDHLLMEDTKNIISLDKNLRKLQERNRKASNYRLDPVLLSKLISSIKTTRQVYIDLKKTKYLNPNSLIG